MDKIKEGIKSFLGLRKENLNSNNSKKNTLGKFNKGLKKKDGFGLNGKNIKLKKIELEETIPFTETWGSNSNQQFATKRLDGRLIENKTPDSEKKVTIVNTQVNSTDADKQIVPYGSNFSQGIKHSNNNIFTDFQLTSQGVNKLFPNTSKLYGKFNGVNNNQEVRDHSISKKEIPLIEYGNTENNNINENKNTGEDECFVIIEDITEELKNKEENLENTNLSSNNQENKIEENLNTDSDSNLETSDKELISDDEEKGENLSEFEVEGDGMTSSFDTKKNPRNQNSISEEDSLASLLNETPNQSHSEEIIEDFNNEEQNFDKQELTEDQLQQLTKKSESNFTTNSENNSTSHPHSGNNNTTENLQEQKKKKIKDRTVQPQKKINSKKTNITNLIFSGGDSSKIELPNNNTEKNKMPKTNNNKKTTPTPWGNYTNPENKTQTSFANTKKIYGSNGEVKKPKNQNPTKKENSGLDKNFNKNVPSETNSSFTFTGENQKSLNKREIKIEKTNSSSNFFKNDSTSNFGNGGFSFGSDSDDHSAFNFLNDTNENSKKEFKTPAVEKKEISEINDSIVKFEDITEFELKKEEILKAPENTLINKETKLPESNWQTVSLRLLESGKPWAANEPTNWNIFLTEAEKVYNSNQTPKTKKKCLADLIQKARDISTLFTAFGAAPVVENTVNTGPVINSAPLTLQQQHNALRLTILKEILSELGNLAAFVSGEFILQEIKRRIELLLQLRLKLKSLHDQQNPDEAKKQLIKKLEDTINEIKKLIASETNKATFEKLKTFLKPLNKNDTEEAFTEKLNTKFLDAYLTLTEAPKENNTYLTTFIEKLVEA